MCKVESKYDLIFDSVWHSDRNLGHWYYSTIYHPGSNLNQINNNYIVSDRPSIQVHANVIYIIRSTIIIHMTARYNKKNNNIWA